MSPQPEGSSRRSKSRNSPQRNRRNNTPPRRPEKPANNTNTTNNQKLNKHQGTLAFTVTTLMRQIWDGIVKEIRKPGDSENLVNDCKQGVNDCDYGILFYGGKSVCGNSGMGKFLDVITNQQAMQEISATQGAMLVGLSIEVFEDKPQEGLLSQPSGLVREEPARTVLAREVSATGAAAEEEVTAGSTPHWKKQGVHSVLHELTFSKSECKMEAVIWALLKKKKTFLEPWTKYLKVIRATTAESMQ